MKLGRKSSDPKQGLKEYCSILSRLINKKRTLNIPPLLENGLFITNVQNKANVLNDYFVEQCCAVSTGSTLSFHFRSVTSDSEEASMHPRAELKYFWMENGEPFAMRTGI